MTGERKSFQVALTSIEDKGRKPVEFDISTTDGSIVEVFEARPWRVPQALMLKAANMRIDANSVAFFKIFEHALANPDAVVAGLDDGTEPTDAQLAEAMLEQGDYPRFEAFITDPSVKVDALVLSQIIDWFFEESTGHPPKPSASSSRGSRRTSRS